ncbi:hypothetical protein ERO13_A10G098800v2 [Gossypium hirsutum]|nr:hypothetical protein ERO13_A10G098800v2 [Gossypium hirsutum]
MAMNVSSACFSVLSCKKPNRIRAVASEDFATTAALKIDTEDKLKLGGSELKVTRLGIGAWSWGDTRCHIFVSGALIGKYKPENPPSGPRGRIYTPEFLTKLQPLLIRIKEIGGNYRKTPTQVVLNWLIAQENVVPIPGAKNAAQAKEFIGALGWRLSNEEVDELRSLASEISPVTGFPVEKL